MGTGTRRGIFENCLLVVSSKNDPEEDVQFIAHDVGRLKEMWNDGFDANGWELQDIKTGKKRKQDYDGDVDGLNMTVFEKSL